MSDEVWKRAADHVLKVEGGYVDDANDAGGATNWGISLRFVKQSGVDLDIDGDGDIIGYYSEYTEMLNPEKVAGTPFTLFDTGDFYKSFILYIYKDAIEVDANPIKINDKGEKENLFWKYGENIIALTDESMVKLRQEFLQRFKTELKGLLQIN